MSLAYRSLSVIFCKCFPTPYPFVWMGLQISIYTFRGLGTDMHRYALSVQDVSLPKALGVQAFEPSRSSCLSLANIFSQSREELVLELEAKL